jgi:hypothetical protein
MSMVFAAQPGEVANFKSARFSIQIGEALAEGAQRTLALAGTAAQRRERAVGAQVRKTGQARVLRIAHASRIDFPVDRAVPLRALLDFGRSVLEMRSELAAAARTAPGEQRRAHHQDGVAVRPREAFAGRLTPRQPGEGGVLLARERHRCALANLKGEQALAIVRDARCEAMAPLRKNLEGIGDVPGRKAPARRIDAGLFAHFARRGRGVRLAGQVERAGDRLPEARARGALEEQHLALCGVHDNEDRKRQLHFST